LLEEGFVLLERSFFMKRTTSKVSSFKGWISSKRGQSKKNGNSKKWWIMFFLGIDTLKQDQKAGGASQEFLGVIKKFAKMFFCFQLFYN